MVGERSGGRPFPGVRTSARGVSRFLAGGNDQWEGREGRHAAIQMSVRPAGGGAGHSVMIFPELGRLGRGEWFIGVSLQPALQVHVCGQPPNLMRISSWTTSFRAIRVQWRNKNASDRIASCWTASLRDGCGSGAGEEQVEQVMGASLGNRRPSRRSRDRIRA